MLDELTTPQQQSPTDDTQFRDIHPLNSPLSNAFDTRRPNSATSPLENYSSMITDFNSMVVAADSNRHENSQDEHSQLGEEEFEETNPLAIVPNPIPSPHRTPVPEPTVLSGNGVVEVPVHVVKKEEVEAKIYAWQTAEIAKVNNRFKREEVVINGVESEQVEKATAWFHKMERKLEEQRAKAVEKMQNEVAKAHRKAEEKRASAEAKRGVKVAKVSELCNLMRAVGKTPSKRSFF